MQADLDNRSLVFVTTPTSGSASMLRILRALNAHLLFVQHPGDHFELFGHIYLIRGPEQPSKNWINENFRYVVNYRDPRDMLCNQYYWLKEHDAPDDNVKNIRLERFKQGIDANVIRVKNDSAYKHVFDIIKLPTVMSVSYAQLCCDFDEMVSRLVSFLGVEPDENAKSLIRQESPEGVASNPRWIGQDWAGCDTMPGRYKHELKPETIALLDKRWAPTLKALQALEQPHLRHFYETGAETT